MAQIKKAGASPKTSTASKTGTSKVGSAKKMAPAPVVGHGSSHTSQK